MHKRAVENGAKVECEPADMDYEDRQLGIIDPSGNHWWISKRLVEKATMNSGFKPSRKEKPVAKNL